MREIVSVAHKTDVPGQPTLSQHLRDMKPQVARSLVLQTGLAESPAMVQAQDELYAFWVGSGVDKVMVEGATCDKCGKVMTQMSVEVYVGPKDFNFDKEHDGRLYVRRARRFPFQVSRALADYGASCDCGGRLQMKTRDLTPEEDF